MKWSQIYLSVFDGLVQVLYLSWWKNISVKTVDMMMNPWWYHQMETFSTLLAICAGNSPGTGEFPAQRPVMRSFDVFFDLRLNKWLSKQSWGGWSETPWSSLWHHCNAFMWYRYWCISFGFDWIVDNIQKELGVSKCNYLRLHGRSFSTIMQCWCYCMWLRQHLALLWTTTGCEYCFLAYDASSYWAVGIA